ncbi:hypothetical protein DGMP_11750 [Desulfomarina profundi]|uniref:Cas10/Cmr2 second palm domain-containing protein n=1 Tax=Desulfomarina profundi TaxID=2772557 RepID=A0A8D5FV72_9BACT|nr:hypothetical protein [Desulfomarina profundi]BCL60482.1 hypothetical protein DGMP_11750 [Desulfomarina profundi]
MPTNYLRIEAVNIANFIEDTEQLSVIRGGGLLLLKAIRNLKKTFKEKNQHFTLEEISTGASVGLFKFSADKPEEIRQQVDDILKKDKNLCYATFVVDIITTDDEKFRNQLEKVIARNHWRQYQQPTLVSPKWNDKNNIWECSLDRLRPATTTIAIKAPEKIVSPPVKIRHDYGRNKKHHFYQNELQRTLNEGITDKFTHDLEKLTANSPSKTLQHKMAVIYTDGNSFGTLQQKFCKTEYTQKKFDDELNKKRATFLSNLLNFARNSDYFSIAIDNEKCLQMETLMWGGDELLLVVPAWQGWQTLALLYQHIETWDFEGEPLYHGAGIVFCHHNAPIHRITRLAKELTEEAKSCNRRKNLFQYCVLESFDYISQDLHHYRKEQFPGTLNSAPLSLDGTKIAAIQKPFIQLKELFPRRKVHSLARAAVQDGRDNSTLLFEKEMERTRDVVDEKAFSSAENLAKLSFFNNPPETDKCPPSMWIHICELWDYICPMNDNGGGI